MSNTIIILGKGQTPQKRKRIRKPKPKKEKINPILKTFSPEKYLDMIVDFSINKDYKNNVFALARKYKVSGSKLTYWVAHRFIRDYYSETTRRSAYVPYKSVLNEFLI